MVYLSVIIPEGDNHRLSTGLDIEGGPIACKLLHLRHFTKQAIAVATNSGSCGFCTYEMRRDPVIGPFAMPNCRQRRTARSFN
jgi:hypothetical protein